MKERDQNMAFFHKVANHIKRQVGLSSIRINNIEYRDTNQIDVTLIYILKDYLKRKQSITFDLTLKHGIALKIY